MEKFRSTIEFISSGSGSGGGGNISENTEISDLSYFVSDSSTSGSFTGDFLPFIIGLILFVFFCAALCFCFIQKKQMSILSFDDAKHVNVKHSNAFGALHFRFLKKLSNTSTIVVFVILAICSFVFCLSYAKNYAIANNINLAPLEYQNDANLPNADCKNTENIKFSLAAYDLSCPEKLSAVVDVDAKTLTIPDGFIKNEEENQFFQLQSIELLGLVNTDLGTWTIKSGDSTLYNDSADQSMSTALDIDSKSNVNLSYLCDMDFDKCKSLVGQNVVEVDFYIQRYTHLTGKVVDKNDRPVVDASVNFGSYSTRTDDQGLYTLFALPGYSGDIKISSSDHPDAYINGVIVEENDFELDTVTMIDLVNEPVVLDSPTYNKEEQVGVEADDSVDLIGYSAVEAGQHIAYATPKSGYAWKDGSTNTKNIVWYINKADSVISAPNIDVACGGITALKHAQYTGDQDKLEEVTVSFDDSSVNLNSIDGTPQDIQFSINCTSSQPKNNVKGTIIVAQSNNYNQAKVDFCINIIASATVKGSVNQSLNNQDYIILLRFADRDGDTISQSVSTIKDFQFSGIPLYSDEPYIEGIVTCNSQGKYAKNDIVVNTAVVVADLTFGPTDLDNYSLDELTNVSEDIAKNGEKSQYYNEFVDYMKNDTYWFSQSNSAQSDEVKSGDVSKADSKLCNQAYKNSFILSGEIEEKDHDLCQFMFLRIIGVNDDVYANTDGTAVGKNVGLTFQAVRSLPRGYSLQDDSGAKVNWWGDANNALRRDLSQDGGLVYSNLADAYKSNIITVQNKAQADAKQESGTNIKTVGDKLFCLSYTEMCSPGTENFDADYYKDSVEGTQYSWYKEQNILGNKKNEVLKDLGQANSGDEMGTKQSIAYQRTPYYGSYEDQQFLTCNMDGKIFTYSKSFSERCGIAPAFCLGSYSDLNHVVMDGQNVEMLDTNDNVIASDRYTSQSSFSFKLRPAAGLSIKEVKVNGEVVSAIDNLYTINVSALTNIEVTTTGESEDSPHIVGSAILQKNVGEDVQTISQADQVVKVYIDGQSKATGITDSNGKFNIDLLDTALVGKSAVVCTDARPGVNGSQVTISSLKKGENLQDVTLHGLDFYTIPEIKAAGDWLSAHASDSDITNTACYKEFYSYMENTCVWYGNSNGKQSNDLSDSNPNAFNPSLANQDYRCFFTDAGENSQYLFLRIIGILHDELSSGNGYAGLTFQTAHSIPVKTVFGGTWWGDSTLRERMQRNGDIFNKLSACNLTDYISSVNKYSQADRSTTPNISHTQDKLFLISYSEAWNTDGVMEKDRSWYGNSGVNTEGYTYEWYKLKNTSGSNGEANPHIKYLHWNNNGADVGEKSSTWQRSVYFDNNAYNMLIRVGALNSWNFDTSGEGLAICFCLGGN